MKTTKLALTVLAATMFAVSIQAVDIFITGAVAFRGQTYNIIQGLYDPGYTQNPAGNQAAASLITWSGTISNLFGAQTVTIYANYNGAVAGVQNLTQNTPAQFLVPQVGNTNRTNGTADLAFSSVYQKSTQFTTPVLNDSIFGVTPVLWLKSTNSSSSLTNITAQQVKELVSNGYLPLSYLTGNTNDTNFIYFVTRDSTAGQRVIVLKDSGFAGAPSAYANNGTNWIFDPTGQTSTGNIINQLNKYSNAVSYLTGVDAISAVTNGAAGASVLSYNGYYPFTGNTLSSVSNNFAPVITGQYSLWGYEHILSRQSPPGYVTAFLNSLTTNLAGSLSTYAYTIPLPQVKVARDSDGGLVYPQ